MRELTQNEMNSIIGGALSGTLISGIVKGAQLILELGRSFGSAIRRFLFGNYC